MRTMQEATKGEARTKFGEQLKRVDSDLMDGVMSDSALISPSLNEQPEKVGLRYAYGRSGLEMQPDFEDTDEKDEQSTSLPKPSKHNIITKSTKKGLSMMMDADVESNEGPTKTFTAGNKQFHDDGISLMDVQIYVQHRLRTKLDSLRTQLPSQEMKVNEAVLENYFFCDIITDYAFAAVQILADSGVYLHDSRDVLGV